MTAGRGTSPYTESAQIRGFAIALLVGLLLVPTLTHVPAPSLACLPGSATNTAPSASTSVGAAMLAEASRSVVLGASPITARFSTHPSTASDGGRWVNLTKSLNPVPASRYAPEMAYDAKDGYVVLFSGENFTQSFDDTWTYKNGTWTQLFPTVSPIARAGGLFVYDPIDQYLVLFSGIDHSGFSVYGDTWTFSGGVWTNITHGGGPDSRGQVAAAWDPVDQSIIMFGGVQNTNGTTTFYSQTWRFVGGTWTELYPSQAPIARLGGEMAWDGADGYLVLFGGANATGVNLDDTWRFLSGNWAQVTSEIAPIARTSSEFVWAPALGSDLLFGGILDNDSALFGDMWTYRGGAWTQQFPASIPEATGYAGIAWDAGDGYVVQFGGIDFVHLPNATTDAQTWVYVTPPNASRSAPAQGDVEESIAASVTVSGGPSPFTENWSFGDGATANGSSVRHAYTRPGTFSLNVTVADAFNVSTELAGSITIHELPSVTLSASPTSLASGNVTLTATVTNGTPPISLTWIFGNGQQATGPGPEVVDYTVAGNFSAQVTATDGAGAIAKATASVTVTGHPSGSTKTPVQPASSTSSSFPWTWIVIAMAVVAVIVASALLVRRRKGPSVPSPGPPAPYGAWPPPTAGTSGSPPGAPPGPGWPPPPSPP